VTPRDELTPEDVLEEYLAERDAVQFGINAGIPPDKWEREFQRTHDALALALARIEAAGLLAFQLMQSAAAVQADPTKGNAVAASWVIGKVGAVLAALRGEEE